MRYILCLFAGMLLPIAAWGQSGSEGCHSSLRVMAGTSTLIDCVFQTESYTYQWTSKNPSWLAYLHDVTAASPNFHAPVDVDMPYQIEYRRLVFDDEGAVVGRGLILVTVYQSPGESVALDGLQSSWSGTEASTEIASDGISELAESEEPFLRCVPRITVNSGEMAVIPCTGLHSSGGLLGYRVELDWPPYSETKSLGVGAFNYSVRAPAIQELASVRMLEIFAWVPGAEHEVSALVEVHVVNRAPMLTCEDLVVDEAVDTRVPCSVESVQAVQIQLISQPALVQPGIYDGWPRLVIPEIERDTSIAVTVRAFAEDQVIEEAFTVIVQNTSGPAEFGIECDPVLREVYEGDPAFGIVCNAIDSPTDELSWTWSAEGETPLELLEPDLTSENLGTATFHVPEEVTEDTFYGYTVTATHADAGTSNRVNISITVLEKPDITVVCEDAQARTGDPPLRLMCTASNSKEIPLTYQWHWTPSARLSDPAVATPLFEVPADQQELIQEYVYEVTASAEFADPPATPTRVVVTVLKNLGQLSLACKSPIEVYAGSPEVPLECSVPTPIPSDIAWTWELLSGTEDLLVQGIGGAPPIFHTPAQIASTTTWTYLLRVDAPPHYDISEPQQVEIIVLARPVLSLECPQRVEVTVGQSPQPIACSVTNDQDLDLAYQWRWTPPTRLSDAAVASPLFDVPLRQRAVSVTYPYTVTVWSDFADPVEASLEVAVLNPATLPSEVMEVTTSGLDLGVVGPRGQVALDPATEQISGQIYEGSPNAGRMILRVQDSVVVSLEQLPSVVLHHSEEDRTLTLVPEWAYSESCVQFLANTQAGQALQSRLEPGDCHVIRIGGTVSLEGATPGTYSGDAAMVLTLNEVEEVYTVPVMLTVGAARQVVVLGPSGVRIEPDQGAMLYGEERVHIWPQVAVFGPEHRRATFELHNPSIYPMEVEISTEFGYREHGDSGSILVNDPGTGPGNLATALSMYPGVVVLLPGETKQVQSAISEPIEERGYAGMLNFAVTPRSYIDQRRAPVPAAPARIMFQIPAVYIPGSEPAPLRAQVESQTEAALIVVFETDTVPFYGQVLVLDDGGREVGRSDLLVVTRSRVRITLDDSSQTPFRLSFVSNAPNQPPPADVLLSDDF